MRATRRKFEIRRNRIRSRISRVSDRVRLSVFKSGRHVYAQIIDDQNAIVIASASTLEEGVKKIKKSNCNKDTAAKIGELIGDRAVKKGIKEVVFDKGGYKYHGVVQALADAARKKLQF